MEEQHNNVNKWVRPADMKPRIFSAMQPTGALHLGNYLGALKNWVDLANTEKYDALYAIVDYHAITIPYEIKEMRERVFEMALGMLATGLPPEKCHLFIQSQVPEHTELCWIFSSLAMMGRLENMTQFKEKSARVDVKDGINAGLFTYPILQAADILVYRAENVPVGEDQSQHLELSREIARRFNNRFGATFPEPQTLLTTSRRIMGLDGENKMSKSLGNQVGVLDDAETVTQKFTRQAASDPARQRLKDPGDPDICYVYSMHKFFTPEERLEGVASECRNAERGCFHCKKELADNVNAMLESFRQKEAELRAHPDYIWDVLRDGGVYARKLAQETLEVVKDNMGLLPPS